MILAPGAITSQALADQIRTNAAIEKELIGIATLKPCAPYMVPPVYQASMNK
jgi:hypothetical protein